MPQPNNAQRKAKLIQLIHIGKSQVGMADAEYRALLANVSRSKTSSKDLSREQLETVLRHMKAQGFVVAVQTPNGREPYRNISEQQQKIRSLWLELHEAGAVRVAAESAMFAFCQKHGGKQWHQDSDAMRDIIERLKKWRDRVV